MTQSLIRGVYSNPTLDGQAEDLVWVGTGAPAMYNVGGVDYYGAEFRFLVLVSDTRDYNALASAVASTITENVDKVRGYARVPDKIVPACAIVAIQEDGPSATFDGELAVTVHVLLLVSRADTAAAQIKLNAYRSTTGA